MLPFLERDAQRGCDVLPELQRFAWRQDREHAVKRCWVRMVRLAEEPGWFVME